MTSALDEVLNHLESLAEDWERVAAHHQKEARHEDAHPNDRLADEHDAGVFAFAAKQVRNLRDALAAPRSAVRR